MIEELARAKKQCRLGGWRPSVSERETCECHNQTRSGPGLARESEGSDEQQKTRSSELASDENVTECRMERNGLADGNTVSSTHIGREKGRAFSPKNIIFPKYSFPNNSGRSGGSIYKPWFSKTLLLYLRACYTILLGMMARMRL